MVDAKTNKKFLDKGAKLNLIIANKLKEKGLGNILISNSEIIGKYIAQDVIEKNNEYIIRSGFDITEEILEKIIFMKLFL